MAEQGTDHTWTAREPGFRIHRLADQKEQPMWVSPVRIFLTADQEQAVLADDPEARFLLVGAGAELPEHEVERWGLRELLAEAGIEAKAMAAPPATKAVQHPPATKRRR